MMLFSHHTFQINLRSVTENESVPIAGHQWQETFANTAECTPKVKMIPNENALGLRSLFIHYVREILC